MSDRIADIAMDYLRMFHRQVEWIDAGLMHTTDSSGRDTTKETRDELMALIGQQQATILRNRGAG